MTQPNNRTAAATQQKLEHDLKAVLHDADALMHVLGNDFSEKTEEAKEKLLQQVTAAKERLAELQEIAKEKISNGVKKTDLAIRTHPYESLAVAFGVGLLVGFLATRRRD